MKQVLFIALVAFPGAAMADWIEYATKANGDVLFYDDARVEREGSMVSVWNRVRYKTSVMGASSFQSHLKIDCAENSETMLQSTFFSDKDWTTPAMATNTRAKPKKSISAKSATAQLAGILCGT